MGRLLASLTCIDCGVLHGRTQIRRKKGPTGRWRKYIGPSTAALCLNCVYARRLGRNRLPASKRYQTNWNRSAAAKLVKDRWYEANREKIAAAYRRRAVLRVRAPHQCEATPCTNQFVRMKGSHRQFCDDCALAFYGPAYARDRGSRRRGGTWRAA